MIQSTAAIGIFSTLFIISNCQVPTLDRDIPDQITGKLNLKYFECPKHKTHENPCGWSNNPSQSLGYGVHVDEDMITQLARTIVTGNHKGRCECKCKEGINTHDCGPPPPPATCPHGFTGDDCSTECNRDGLDHWTTEKRYSHWPQGKCYCKSGWTGNEFCDPPTGLCSGREISVTGSPPQCNCKQGWGGERCLDKCDGMKSGQNCDECYNYIDAPNTPCSVKCFTRGTQTEVIDGQKRFKIDKTKNECVCNEGWTGNNCAVKKCITTKAAWENDCPNQQICKSILLQHGWCVPKECDATVKWYNQKDCPAGTKCIATKGGKGQCLPSVYTET